MFYFFTALLFLFDILSKKLMVSTYSQMKVSVLRLLIVLAIHQIIIFSRPIVQIVVSLQIDAVKSVDLEKKNFLWKCQETLQFKTLA